MEGKGQPNLPPENFYTLLPSMLYMHVSTHRYEYIGAVRPLFLFRASSNVERIDDDRDKCFIQMTGSAMD